MPTPKAVLAIFLLDLSLSWGTKLFWVFFVTESRPVSPIKERCTSHPFSPWLCWARFLKKTFPRSLGLGGHRVGTDEAKGHIKHRFLQSSNGRC